MMRASTVASIHPLKACALLQCIAEGPLTHRSHNSKARTPPSPVAAVTAAPIGRTPAPNWGTTHDRTARPRAFHRFDTQHARGPAHRTPPMVREGSECDLAQSLPTSGKWGIVRSVAPDLLGYSCNMPCATAR